jgi:hypothetical protein
VNSLPLATIYEVKIPLRKWKKSLLQRNPAQMTWANVILSVNLTEKNIFSIYRYFGRIAKIAKNPNLYFCADIIICSEMEVVFVQASTSPWPSVSDQVLELETEI